MSLAVGLNLVRKVIEAASSLQNIANHPPHYNTPSQARTFTTMKNLKSYKLIIFDQLPFNSIIITILPNIYQKSFLHLHSSCLEELRGKVVNNVNIRCRSMASFMIATEKELLLTGQADEWIAESFLTQW